MRKLIWVCIVLAVMWCGWWVLAMSGAQRAVTALSEGAEGYDIQVDEVVQAGFPFAFKNRLSGVVIADRTTGVGLSASHIDIETPAYWPGKLTAVLPPAPIRLIHPDGDLTWQAAQGVAHIDLRPGPALELETARLDAGGWKLGGAGGTILSAADLAVVLEQSSDQAESYQLSLSSDALTPGGLIRTALQLPNTWPLSFETFEAQMTLGFDRPLDRFASDNPPALRALEVQSAQAVWGALRFSADGALEIDGQGVPSGTATLRAQNWRDGLALLIASGVVPAGADVQAETILGMIARMSGDPAHLDVPLTFEGGQMRMGPIPLGPAPRISIN